MTIKHLGGIFGRNPTFNEVNVDGNIIMADGSGIDFSATSGTGTSELFDDYEEGTWTPTTDTGTVSGSGKYTKIGNRVIAHGLISSFSDRSSANNISVGGLPYSTTDFQAAGSAAGRRVNVAASSIIVDSSNRLYFYTMSIGNYVILTHNDLNSSAAAIYFQIAYLTS